MLYSVQQADNTHINFIKDKTNVQKGNEKPNSLFEQEKKSATNDGKFTVLEASKNLATGILSPIKAFVDHPLIAIGTIATIGTACLAVPVLTPILTIGFGALSLFEIGKGTFEAIDNYSNGEYDAAEKSMEEIGTGITGTLLSILGLKASAKIAIETKKCAEIGNFLDAGGKTIAYNRTPHTINGVLKENLSILTTKEGWNAIKYAFKPANIKKQFKPIETPKKVNFDETLEGQRRAKMKTSDVEQEVESIVAKSFDEMGIPKDFRPRLKIEDELRYQTPENANKALSEYFGKKVYIEGGYKAEFFKSGENLLEMSEEQIITRIKAVLESNEKTEPLAGDINSLNRLVRPLKSNEGGEYSQDNHLITFKTGAWRKGTMSTEEIATHEALHAKMAILRNSLSKEEAALIMKQELRNRIINGEPEQIIVQGGFLGNETMQAPKMSTQMRQEFLQFADDFLYKGDEIYTQINERNDAFRIIKKGINKGVAHENLIPIAEKIKDAETKLAPILDRLNKMLDNNPDFIIQNGGTRSESLNVLLKYIISHEVRFKSFSDPSIKGLKQIPLTPEEHQQAAKSLVGILETAEGNSAAGGLKIFGPTQAEFNQYQFSYEELMARNTAIEFEKSKINIKLQNSNLSTQQKEELLSRLDVLELQTEYNTVGKEYYNAYKNSLNNSENTSISGKVRTLEQMLDGLDHLKKVKLGQVEPDRLYKTRGSIPWNSTPYLLKDDEQTLFVKE